MRASRAAAAAMALVAAGTAQAQTAPAMPSFRFEPMAPPVQPKEIALPLAAPVAGRSEEWFLQNGQVGVRNVVRPALTPVLPVRSPTGAAVIVAPGGGFLGLAIDTEGWQVARWLAQHGIAAFVLKYRVLETPASLDEFAEKFNRMRRGEKVGFAPPEDTPAPALEDAIAAIRLVRSRAGEFGVDPSRIGFMGFSAGGFLARSIVGAAGADMPAFIAPIYPRLNPIDVPANAPPMFLLLAADDPLFGKSGFGLVESWRAAGKPVEFHMLASGGHGFGLGRPGTSSVGWIEQFHRWLDSSGFLKSAN